MKKAFCILLSLAVFDIALNGQNLDIIRTNVQDHFVGFIETFEGFSGCGPSNRSEAQQKQRQLIDAFANTVSALHFNDLSLPHSKEYEVSEYLTTIMDEYQNSLDVEFTDIEIEECLTEKNDKTYLMAYANKRIQFPNAPQKTYACCFIYNVSLNSYKIDRAIELGSLPQEYKCNNEDRLKSDEKFANEKFEDYKEKGDEEYADGNYAAARDYYEIALKYKRDGKLVLKYEECKKQLSLEYLLSVGEEQLSKRNYEQARVAFEEALAYKPKDTALQAKIQVCKDKIQDAQNENCYQYNRSQGESNFNSKFFQAAKGFFQKALNCRPNDTYCKDMLAKCDQSIRLNDDRFVNERLASARNLVETGKVKNYAEAVAIYTELIPSGKLNGQDFYSLGLIMDGQIGAVKNRMNYSNRYCANLAAEYLYQSAIVLKYEPAREKWKYHFSAKTKSKRKIIKR